MRAMAKPVTIPLPELIPTWSSTGSSSDSIIASGLRCLSARVLGSNAPALDKNDATRKNARLAQSPHRHAPVGWYCADGDRLSHPFQIRVCTVEKLRHLGGQCAEHRPAVRDGLGASSGTRSVHVVRQGSHSSRRASSAAAAGSITVSTASISLSCATSVRCRTSS